MIVLVPFPDSAAVRESIDIIQRVFRLRTCADSVFANRSRPCLLHAVRRCSAPCVNLISPSRYVADVAAARAFLRGDIKNISVNLSHDMEEAAKREEFETAAALRDCLRALTVVRAKHFPKTRMRPVPTYRRLSRWRRRLCQCCHGAWRAAHRRESVFSGERRR